LFSQDASGSTWEDTAGGTPKETKTKTAPTVEGGKYITICSLPFPSGRYDRFPSYPIGRLPWVVTFRNTGSESDICLHIMIEQTALNFKADLKDATKLHYDYRVASCKHRRPRP
jgi:hypothetical protein